MSDASQQPELPEGLHLVRQLNGAGVFGKVYEVIDQRPNKALETHRLLRILDNKVDGDAWKKPLLERTQRLLPLRLPYIAIPSEAGENPDGSVYLVGDLLAQTLSSRIRADQGLPPQEARTIAHQLLEGLAALHDAGIPHGDLRPQNVYFATTGGASESKSVWIADTAISGLTWWSDGALRDPEASYYYPPEWKHQAKQPSAKADLYALGLLIVEMLLGKKYNPNREEDPATNRTTWERLKPRLSDKKIPSDLRQLVKLLLAKDEDRPADAGEALRRFDKLQLQRARRPWRRTALALTVVAVIAIVGLVFRFGSVADKLEKQLADAKDARNQAVVERSAAVSALAETTAEAKVLNERVKTLKKENEDLIKRLPPTEDPKPPPPIEIAKGKWSAAYRTGQVLDGTLRNIQQVFEKEGNSEVKEYLRGWYKAVQNFYGRAQPWLNDYPELKTAYLSFAGDPWGDEKTSAAKRRLDALEKAGKEWIDWVINDDYSFADLEGFIDRLGKEEQTILKRWLADTTKRSHGKWTLRLISGTAKPGKDFLTRRRVNIDGDGSWTWTKGKDHFWSEETGHIYGSEDERDTEFVWAQGHAVAIFLEGKKDWTGARLNVISTKTFSGPLAVYWLHRAGQISDAEGSITLKFEIVGCPGPPKSFGKFPLSN